MRRIGRTARAPLRRDRLPPLVRDWLTESGSLTQRCQRHFPNFQLQPLGLQHQAPLWPLMRTDRQPAVPGLARQHWPVREVMLCDGSRPFIVAHSVLTGASQGPLLRWLRGLGRRSLGSLLFRHPGFQRGELAYFRLDARDALFRRCVQVTGQPAPRAAWARGCEHRFARQSVWVFEVFWGLAQAGIQ